MIRYRLACHKSHEFEAWFPSSEGCDAQIVKKLVACPTCGSTKVAKTLMAPSVVTSERKAKSRGKRRIASEEVASPTVGETPAPVTASRQMLSGPQREMLRQLKTMRDKILADAEYVGPRFAEEARKIHHEGSPSRGIYGEASVTDIEELASEGIDIFPVPVLPEDHN